MTRVSDECVEMAAEIRKFMDKDRHDGTNWVDSFGLADALIAAGYEKRPAVTTPTKTSAPLVGKDNEGGHDYKEACHE